MQVDIPVKMTDRIKCKECGRVLLVSQLISEDGPKFPRPDKAGHVWQTKYYYCVCNNPGVKVYDPGDGRDFMLGEKAEIVR